MQYLPGHGLVHELLGGALVGLGFAMVFATAELWRRRGRPRPEATRKQIHGGGGVVAAVFPRVFA
jgi:hypothetical protein